MKKKDALYAQLILVLAVAMLCTQCGPSAQAPTEAPPPPTEAAPTAEAVAPTEVAAPSTAGGNVFVYADPDSFPDLDPAMSYSSESYAISNCYETLVFYNPPGSAETLSGKLATRWEHNEDATEWTFYLREGVKFQDGSPFNAEAVKYSFSKTKELGMGAAYMLDPISEIEIVDDHTVKFHLSYPAPLDLISSAGYGAWIYNPQVYEEKGTDWFKAGNCAGTGPYFIESFEPGTRLVMTRFDDYWGGWKEGQFDKIVYDEVRDPAILQQMIESGSADFTFQVPPDNLPSLEQRDDLTVHRSPSMIVMLAQYNTQKAPLDNVLVRRALSYAFPFDDLLSAMGGRAVLAHGPIPPGMWGHSDDVFQFSYDLEKAKELLTEAGYPAGGFDLVLTYLSDDLDKQLVGELWKPELAKLGINLELQGLTWDAQWDLGKSGPDNAQDIFVQVWWPDYMSPISFLYALFHTEEEVFFNLNYYSNPEFDQLIDDANTLEGVDRDKAAEMYVESQDILMEDIPCLFVYYLANAHITRNDIEGYVDNSAYPHVVFVYHLTRK